MRIIKPGGNSSNATQMTVPAWLDTLTKQVVRKSELKCGCIIDRLPKSIIKIAGNRPEVLCEIHGFQRIKRDVPFREIIARQTNLAIDEKFIPPF